MKTMAQVFASANMAGGTSGAVQTDFPTSVNNVFQNPSKAAMVLEGDFVPGVATVKAKAGRRLRRVRVPVDQRLAGDRPDRRRHDRRVQGHARDPGVRELPRLPGGRHAWAKKGGFATGNRNMPASVYPDATTRATASAIAKAKNVAFDMSDQQPAAFGATVGQGEWGLFQDFLRNPSNVCGNPEQARVLGGVGLQEVRSSA